VAGAPDPRGALTYFFLAPTKRAVTVLNCRYSSVRPDRWMSEWLEIGMYVSGDVQHPNPFNLLMINCTERVHLLDIYSMFYFHTCQRAEVQIIDAHEHASFFPFFTTVYTILCFNQGINKLKC
jgi:hypothetical protein